VGICSAQVPVYISARASVSFEVRPVLSDFSSRTPLLRDLDVGEGLFLTHNLAIKADCRRAKDLLLLFP